MNSSLIEFKVNGTSYTVLKLLGEGGYSQVLPGFWYLIGTDGKKYNSSFKCDQVYEVYNADREIFALKIVNLKVSFVRMCNLNNTTPWSMWSWPKSMQSKSLVQMECSVEMKGELIREILFLEKMKKFRHVVIFFKHFNWLHWVPGEGLWIWD